MATSVWCSYQEIRNLNIKKNNFNFQYIMLKVYYNHHKSHDLH